MTDKKDKKPIGVLFVHGIGEQIGGATLLDSAGPLYDWINRWLKGSVSEEAPPEASKDKTNKIEILDVDLKPSDGSPAYMKWQLEVQQDSSVRESEWLLAEDWWAEAVYAPGFWQTLLWVVQIIPSMILLHYFTLISSFLKSTKGPRFVWLVSLPFYILYIPLSVILVVLIEIIALILVVLSIVPLASVRSFVGSVQGVVMNRIGDIYLFNRNPIQQAIMVARFKKNLNWLHERCDKIAIIAHSQGAAISYKVLSQERPDSVLRLITYGSAIKLMKNISYVVTTPFYTFATFVSALLPLVVIVVAVNLEKIGASLNQLRQIDEMGRAYYSMDSFRTLIFLVFIIIAVIYLCWFLFYYYEVIFSRTSRPTIDKAKEDNDEKFRWIDLYASADPAPNGQLADDPPKYMCSRPIYNYSSLFLDHTTYWQNRDEFIPAVVSAIGELSEIDFFKGEGVNADYLNETRQRREWRTEWLVRGRQMVLVSSLISAYALRNVFFNGEIGVSSFLVPWLIPWINKALNSISIGQLPIDSRIPQIISGSIQLLGIAFLGYVFMILIWTRWETRDVHKFFNRAPYDFGGVPFVLFLVYNIVIFAVTLFLISDPAFLGSTGRFIWQNGIMLATASLAICIYSVVFTSMLIREKRPYTETYGKLLVSVALRTALLASPFVAASISDGVLLISSFCGIILLIPILVLLYDRYIGSHLRIWNRVSSWLTRRSTGAFSNSPQNTPHITQLIVFREKWREHAPGIASLLFGIIAITVAGIFHLEKSGWVLLVGYGAVHFGVITAIDPNRAKWLRAASIIGIILAMLSCVILLYP